ncbi:protein of unknown function [Vibrio tapetis subsp. tapetis]|uniref:Uncharacterized protein n=1 Tax=Vibrio tapetis subsp. tapetis TaxID=1671868 RepID=A0A2N8ZBZ4_9VIBR|nr:protein of unknown function [Vibrio tapetis subsp. tapetis]
MAQLTTNKRTKLLHLKQIKSNRLKDFKRKRNRDDQIVYLMVLRDKNSDSSSLF